MGNREGRKKFETSGIADLRQNARRNCGRPERFPIAPRPTDIREAILVTPRHATEE